MPLSDSHLGVCFGGQDVFYLPETTVRKREASGAPPASALSASGKPTPSLSQTRSVLWCPGLTNLASCGCAVRRTVFAVVNSTEQAALWAGRAVFSAGVSLERAPKCGTAGSEGVMRVQF